jgi:predicted CXXCH cytochrome family protein
MKKTAAYIVIIVALVLTPTVVATHVANPDLIEGCGSCHVGHGISNEPMLAASQEEACYLCHGSADKSSLMVSAGKLTPTASPADIEREFKKPYRHPVENSGEHSPRERLPNFSKARVSHAECVDCHNPHQRNLPGVPQVAEVSGYSISGQYLDKATREYEICLKCHSDVVGGKSSGDIRTQFEPGVRSMHPVTRPVVSGRRISLTASIQSGGTMTCSDCHRSAEPDGPRGPHGSIYEFMLSGNYTTDGETDENPLAYQFCYSCHERSSILANESFPLHREHIEGDPLKSIPGTSCYTCHSSHSSEKNPYLIQFNGQVVDGTPMGDRIEFRSMGERSGECYLKCHGRIHDPAQY